MSIPLSMIFDELSDSGVLEQVNLWTRCVDLVGEVGLTWDGDSEAPSFAALTDAARFYAQNPRLLAISQQFVFSWHETSITGSIYVWRAASGNSFFSVTPWSESLHSHAFTLLLRTLREANAATFPQPVLCRFAVEQSEPREIGGRFLEFTGRSFEDIANVHADWMKGLHGQG